jgi:hypothetical protein
VRFVRDVYRAGARYVSQVVAADADEAIEAAAEEFRTDVRKLIAVRRWEVAWEGHRREDFPNVGYIRRSIGGRRLYGIRGNIGQAAPSTNDQ